MPRVGEEHLEARRRQILDAARQCFAANGFHATSMQDILRASGLSAGAVYRYFPGKEDIIGAIAEEAIGTMRDAFGRDAGPLTVAEILDQALAAVDARVDREGLGRVAFQVYAESLRSERLRERIAGAVLEARQALADRLARDHGDEVDAEAVAAVVTALLPGYLHARVVVGDMDAERYRRGLVGLAALLR